MDIRDITNVFVAENCARTASAGAQTIDGQTVPIGSVQIHVKEDDAGAAAQSYYGPGELVITDDSGIVLDNTVTAADAPSIAFHQRSLDGKSHFAQVNVKGSKITSYNFTPYAARVEQVTVITNIDNSLNDHTYMLKIRRFGTDNNNLKRPSVKTAMFKSAAAGSTVDEIIQGLADYINANFQNDDFMPVQAIADTVNDELRIIALPLPWDLDNFRYDRLTFNVELANFTATLQNNMYNDLTVASGTYTKATLGAGSYQQVAEMESQAKLNTGANRDKVARSHVRRSEVPLDAQEFEDDGTTPNRYDTIIINWENTQGDFQAGVKQQGSIACFLPLDDNATNQQSDIIGTLNQYIVTQFGVGSAITLSTP
jgi:hypothetical protein